MKKILSAICIFALCLFSLTGVTVFAESNVTFTQSIGAFNYSEKTYDDGGKQAMFMGEYKPSADSEYEFVLHSVRDKSAVTLSTVMDIAKDYESTTNRKVLLATNGDYFDFNSGVNVESFAVDGVVYSKGVYAAKHCMGFDNNGKAVVGKLTQTEKRLMVVSKEGERTFYPIDSFNAPSESGVAVYTETGKHTVEGAAKFVATTESTNLNQYPIWGKPARTQQTTGINDDPITLTTGRFAVVVKDDTLCSYFTDTLVSGSQVNLVEIPSGDFAGCNWIIGGYDILVENGTVNTNPHTDNAGSSNAPRTFFGFKQDGTALLCVVDGRQSGYSVGITVKKEAELAKSLGLVTALELDGGGSSTVILRVGGELTLRNRPSDGKMRKVSNAVLLVEKKKQSTIVPPDDKPNEKPDDKPSGEITTPPANPPSNDNTVIYIVVGVIAGVAVIGAIVAVVLIKRKKKN